MLSKSKRKKAEKRKRLNEARSLAAKREREARALAEKGSDAELRSVDLEALP